MTNRAFAFLSPPSVYCHVTAAVPLSLIVVTVLEIDTARCLPCETLAWIVFPFLSLAGMVHLVYRDVLFGMRLREPARLSFVQRAAQASLERVATFLSS